MDHRVNGSAAISDEIQDYIAEVATEAAKAAYISGIDGEIDRAAVVEILLRNYKCLEALALDAEAELQAALSTGSGARTIEGAGLLQTVREQEIHALWLKKVESYERAARNFHEVESLVDPFRESKQFIVIRMCYWNEDAQGGDRGADAEPYTWKEMGLVLGKDEKTLRRWHNKITGEIVAALFEDCASY